MKRFIAVTKENREFLAKTFKVTDRTVWNALTFDANKGNTTTAKRIRKVAIERGGVTMVELQEMETFHDADGHMRQYMPNGVLIDFDKKSGAGEVWHKGEMVRRYENVKLDEVTNVQAYALSLR